MAPRIPRLAIYGAASTALAGAVVASSLQTAPNFFAAAVALGRSSGALMALANFALFNVICFGIAFKTVFFGRLRSIEYEHLFERLWLFVTESLLALTIFRRDFSIAFMLMYGTLVFLKCFHWITADRVDYMDQVPPPGPPKLFHIRAINIILLLTIVDALLVGYCLEAISIEGVSSMVLFASEFMILLASINGTAARYVIGLVDLRRARGREDAPTWEAKSMYIFYVDLVVDFAKLLTYLAFFTVIFLHYGLPLHILRDVYMTLRSFLSRCGDLIRYRRATRDMDALYPDATVEEMERLGDKTCIICREELVVREPGESRSGDGGPNDTPKKLVCGHVFHFYCLRSWLERQQSCPTCRRDVLRPTAASTRAAARAAPPADPAAGAHPQPTAPPPGNANPAANPPNPLDAAANAFRLNLDEYFPRRDAAAQGAAAAPGGQGENSAPPASQPSAEEINIQTGIWGGPIIPGRFFPTPLGAGPRLDGPGPSTRSSSHIRFKIPDRSSPETSFTHSSSLPTTTTSTTTLSPLSSIAEPSLPDEPSAATNHEEEEDEVPIASPEEARRQAAEAAMRRFGLTPAAAANTSSSNSSVPVLSPPSNTLPPSIDTTTNGSDYKGKGKAKVEESWDDPPTYMPFLSTPSLEATSLHAQRGVTPLSSAFVSLNGLSSPPWSADRSRDGEPGAPALEERLQALRQVDDVIWSLVGELTRLKSRWEAVDEAIALPSANGHAQPPAEVKPTPPDGPDNNGTSALIE